VIFSIPTYGRQDPHSKKQQKGDKNSYFLQPNHIKGRLIEAINNCIAWKMTSGK